MYFHIGLSAIAGGHASSAQFMLNTKITGNQNIKKLK